MDATAVHGEQDRRWRIDRREWRHAHAARLLEHMALTDIDVLHVHRSALPMLGLPAELQPPPAPGERRPVSDWLDGAHASTRSLAPSITWEGREILIGAYQDGAGDPFAEAADGRELVEAAIAFRDAFERPWTFRHSAILTGWKLMHAPWASGKRGRQLRASGFGKGEMIPPIGSAQHETPFGSWARSRRLRGRPTDDGYVLAYDVNGQRLAACSRLRLGVGEPEHFPIDRGQGIDPKDCTLPGYLHVRAVRDPFPGRIPPPFAPGWHTTPRVRMAAQLGVELDLDDAWLWPEHVNYLDPFYETMRHARSALLARKDEKGARLATGALKQAYLQPFGRLRATRAAAQGSLHYRPSWYDHVIGQELAREYLRLHQLADCGVPVLAVYFDTIIIESPTPDPIGGSPAAIEVSEQLGKYKPVGVLDAREARAILYGQGGPPNVGALAKALNER